MRFVTATHQTTTIKKTAEKAKKNRLEQTKNQRIFVEEKERDRKKQIHVINWKQ